MKLNLLKNYIKQILSYILIFFIRYLNIKQKNNKISFISYPDLSDNAWYLFKYINQNRTNLILIWLVDDISNKKKIDLSNEFYKKNKIIISKKWSLNGIYHYLSSRIVFSTHGSYFFSKKNIGPVNVNLWHGMPIKKIGYLDQNQKYTPNYSDYYLSTSELYSRILSKAFDVKKSKVLNFGLPRNDLLHPKSLLRKNIPKYKNKIWRKNKLIIWLPTYRFSYTGHVRKDSSTLNFLNEWPDNFLDNLNKIAKNFKIILIIKLHPLDLMNNKMNTKKLSNIKIYDNFNWEKNSLDLYELIFQSDGLITDISSVIIDYIITKKPLGLTTKTLKFYNRGLIEELKLFQNINFLKLNTIKDFENFFLKVKKNLKFNIDPKGIYYSKGHINSSMKIVKKFKI